MEKNLCWITGMQLSDSQKECLDCHTQSCPIVNGATDEPKKVEFSDSSEKEN